MDYLNAGGKQRPFRFSWRALTKLAAELGVKEVLKLDDVLESPHFEHIPLIIFFGVESGYRKEGVECNVTLEDVNDWIDEDMSLIQRSTELLNQQLAKHFPEEKKAVPKAKGPAKK